jgi:hypothetical protein
VDPSLSAGLSGAIQYVVGSLQKSETVGALYVVVVERSDASPQSGIDVGRARLVELIVLGGSPGGKQKERSGRTGWVRKKVFSLTRYPKASPTSPGPIASSRSTDSRPVAAFSTANSKTADDFEPKFAA